MDPLAKRFDIRDYACAFRKRKWLILGIILCSLFVGFALTRVAEPLYRAESVVLVKSQPRGFFMITGENPRWPEMAALETETLRARTMSLAQAAAQRYQHETASVDPVDLIAQRVHQSLSAESRQPNIIHLYATASDPDTAVRYANSAADAFVDTDRSSRQSEVAAAREFIEEQLEQAEAALRRVEQDIAEYQQEHGIIHPERDTTDAVQMLAQYRAWRAEAEADRSTAEATMKSLAARLSSETRIEAVTKPVQSPVLVELDRRLGEKEAELAQARARYTEDHPLLQELGAEVAELRAERDRRENDSVLRTEYVDNPMYTVLRGEAADWEAKAAGLRQRVEVLDRILNEHISTLKDLPAKQAHMQKLLADREIARESYRALLQRLTEVSINQAMKQPKVEVLDKAVAAVKVAPQTSKTMVFALLIGLLSSLGLALVLELSDTTIHSPEDLQGDLALPFLGMVPFMDDRRDDHLVTAKAPKSPPAEAYRTLRSNINFSLLDEPAKTILVTSAGAGEGKTMTVANLGVVMAQAGQSVLLIDSDMRRPELHRYLENDSAPGLTNALAGDASVAEIIHDTSVPNLRLVPSGPLPPNPAELLGSEKMDELLEKLRERADVCILDSPPVLALTDGMILASKADQTILVAESGRVTKDAFREMKRLIENARGTILGVVINKMRPSSGDYYYYYYYYDYLQEEGDNEGKS